MSDFTFVVRKHTSNSNTMTRQFFVGGNFKLNPPSITASQSIIDILNKGDLDPETGMCRLSIEDGDHMVNYPTPTRGRDRSTIYIPYSSKRYRPQGYQTSRTELLFQGVRRFHWRDQVCAWPAISLHLTLQTSHSPKQLVDSGIPYVIIGAPSLKPHLIECFFNPPTTRPFWEAYALPWNLWACSQENPSGHWYRTQSHPMHWRNSPRTWSR